MNLNNDFLNSNMNNMTDLNQQSYYSNQNFNQMNQNTFTSQQNNNLNNNNSNNFNNPAIMNNLNNNSYNTYNIDNSRNRIKRINNTIEPYALNKNYYIPHVSRLQHFEKSFDYSNYLLDNLQSRISKNNFK